MPVFNPENLRKDFPILQRMNRGKPLIYLDNAATTQKPKVVIDSLKSFYESNNSNVHRGVYELAEDAEKLYLQARQRVANWLGVQTEEIIFVRGATEGLNLIAHAYAKPNLHKGDIIILTEMEHHANIVPWQMIAQGAGAEIEVIPVLDDGSLDLTKLQNALEKKSSKILSLCQVSNVLGTANPVKEIIRNAHLCGVKVVVDGAQSLPHQRVNLSDLDCDFFVFSGHKVYGPMGIGAIYAKKELLNNMTPYQSGGDMIDQVSFEGTTFADGYQRFEAGTPNVSGAVGLGEAINYLATMDFSSVKAHEQDLLSIVRDGLGSIDGLTEHGTTENKAAVFCFTIDGVHPHDLATLLDAEGIATRTGHHCCQPLMKKLGHEATARASFAFYNTQEEADKFARTVHRVINLLR